MGKSTLKLIGVYEAWSRGVRQGRLTRANGTEGAVLVRVHDDQDATPERLARLREDARLLARLQHEGVLRLEHVSSVGGKVGEVYEGFECASAARVLRVLRARNQVLPARAAVETAAAVGLAIDEALRIVDGDRAVFHPGPVPDDVLIDTAGRVKLAGFRVTRPEDPPAAAPKGYAAPEGRAGAPAATYLVGALLVELLSGETPPDAAAEPERHEAAVRRALIRVLARPGDTPGEPVVQALRQALAHEPAIRGAPGAFGKKLRELAVALASPGLRAWAPGSIPSVQRFGAAADARSAAGALPLLPEETRGGPPAGSPLGANQTIAPLGGVPLGANQTIAPLGGAPLGGAPLGANRTIAPMAEPPRARQPLPEAMSSTFARGQTIVPTGELSDEVARALAEPPPAVGPRRGGGPVTARPGATREPEIPTLTEPPRAQPPRAAGPGAAGPSLAGPAPRPPGADTPRAVLPPAGTAPVPQPAPPPVDLVRGDGPRGEPRPTEPPPAGPRPPERAPLAGPDAGPAPGRLVAAGPSAGPAAGPAAGPSAGPVAGPSVGPVAGPSAGPVAGGPTVGPTPGPSPSGPSIVAPRRPTALPVGPAPSGPALDAYADGDESEATVVAGHRPLGPEIPLDPLAPEPVARDAGPLVGSGPVGARASVLDDEPEAPPKRGMLVPVLVGVVALAALAIGAVGLGVAAMRTGVEEEAIAPAAVVTPADAGSPAPPAPAPSDTPAEEGAAPTEPAAAPSPPASSTPPASATPGATPAAPAASAPAAPAAAPAATTSAAPASAAKAPPPAATTSAAPAATTKAPPPAPKEPAAAPSTRAPASNPTAASSSGAPAEDDDDAPVRIAPKSEPAASPAPAAAAPAPVAESAPAAPAAPEPSSFRVSFAIGHASISSLEVKCASGEAQTGTTVVVEQAPKGNCRVTGRGDDAPLITMVTVVADRSYTCFSGRAPSCK